MKNGRAKILWDILVRDKVEKKAVVIWKKEQEKLGEYQDLRQQLERIWGLKKTVVPMAIGALWAVTPKLEE